MAISRNITIGENALEAVDAARQAFENVSNQSQIISMKKYNQLPKFDHDEIELGSLLGKGGFSDVYEITGFDSLRQSAQLSFISTAQSDSTKPDTSFGDFSVSSNDNKKSSIISSKEIPLSYEEFESKKFLAKHCLREESRNARYAIKFLSKTTIGDKFVQGAADLVTEAFLLSNISHPSIIKIRGISGSGVDGFACPFSEGYFILMDRLYETMNEKLKSWTVKNKKLKWLPHSKINSKISNKQFLADRLNAAFDIAGALQYMHKNNIIYRDLKPENIGFDIRGDPKIFDFGLARELREDEMNADGTYHLSITGTRRYMAPEVAKCYPYNKMADSYSFGVLLFEICSLVKPWKKYSHIKHEELVIYGGERPSLQKSLPFSVKELIKMAWDDSWSRRPSFDYILDILRKEVACLRNNDDSGLEHANRRSTFVFKNNKLSRRFSNILNDELNDESV